MNRNSDQFCLMAFDNDPPPKNRLSNYLNFDQGQCLSLRAFVQMFGGLSVAGDDTGNGIDLNSFKSGCTMFIFDGSDTSYWELAREGTVSLNIQFGAQLPQGVAGVVFTI